MSDQYEEFNQAQQAVDDALMHAHDAIDWMLRTARGETHADALTPTAEIAALTAERLAELTHKFIRLAIDADARWEALV